MPDEFERDIEDNRNALSEARAELLAVVRGLRDGELDRARRGGWSVRKVLEHLVQSEWLYARLVQHLRGPAVQGDIVSGAPASVQDAEDRLSASRAALLAAVEGVDEESFYRLSAVGHEEYSILSVLENAANHDREHAEQVRGILSF